jgi:tetratricopeptide (TPR) repeat protein
MKKFVFVIITLVCAAGFTFAQAPSLYVTESDHYRVYSEISTENAESVAKRMEAYADLFNNYLRFDMTRLEAKLNVRVFAEKSRFDSYLTSIVGTSKNNFVYLQYSSLKKSELVCYDIENEREFETALIRHAFIQFFKSFIKNPPLWMQQGFAVYFEKSTYDPEHDFAVYKENLGWLETLKNLVGDSSSYTNTEGPSLLTLSKLLEPDAATLSEKGNIFHAQAWGFIMFLLNSENNNYNRLLWDAISSLEQDATENENEQYIYAKTFNWVNEYLLYTDFTTYISSIKTFPDVVKEGVDLYTLGNYDDAEKAFIKAISLDGSHYIPYYYLGLIHYTEKDYSLAEYYYQSSLMLGANQALVYYALGVNAFADSRYNDAENYLMEAVDMDSATYASKTEGLFERIDAAKAGNVDFSE